MLMCLGAGDPNSNPHIYIANTLLIESHAQPCSNALFVHLSILWEIYTYTSKERSMDGQNS